MGLGVVAEPFATTGDDGLSTSGSSQPLVAGVSISEVTRNSASMEALGLNDGAASGTMDQGNVIAQHSLEPFHAMQESAIGQQQRVSAGTNAMMVRYTY